MSHDGRKKTSFQERKPNIKQAYSANDELIKLLNIGSKRTKNSIALVLDNTIDSNVTFEINDVTVIKIDPESNDNVFCTIGINKIGQRDVCAFFDKLENKICDLVMKDATQNKYFQKGARHMSRFTVNEKEYQITLLFHLPLIVLENIRINQIRGLVGKQIDIILQAQSIWIEDGKNECGLIYKVHTVRLTDQRIIYKFSDTHRDTDLDLEEKIHRGITHNDNTKKKSPGNGRVTETINDDLILPTTINEHWDTRDNVEELVSVSRTQRDIRDPRDTRDTRDPHDPRDTRDLRDPRDTREIPVTHLDLFEKIDPEQYEIRTENSRPSRERITEDTRSDTRRINQSINDTFGDSSRIDRSNSDTFGETKNRNSQKTQDEWDLKIDDSRNKRNKKILPKKYVSETYFDDAQKKKNDLDLDE